MRTRRERLLKAIEGIRFLEKNPKDEIGFLTKTNLIKEGQSINKPKPLFKEISQKETEDLKKRFQGAQ